MYSETSITTANIFPTLRNLIEEDLSVIQTILADNADDQIKELLESIQRYKLAKMNKLPEESSVNEVVSTPMNGSQLGSYSKSIGSWQTAVPKTLISDIYAAEKAQFDYVKRFAPSEGMPDELAEKLQSVLKMYQSAIEQLERMKKTSQVSGIVLNI